MRTRSRWDGRAIAGLVVLVLGLFADVIFGDRVFYDRDIHLEWYSQMEGFVRSVTAGAWPVWDNTIAFGQPLLADPSAQVAYPPTWLNLLLPPWDYYTVLVVGHCLFTALGMFVLARQLKMPVLAAFAAAGVWAASGPLLSLVNVWHHFSGACWIPWVAVAALRAVAAPGLGPTLIWSVTQALQIVAGSAEMATLGIAASGLLAGMTFAWTPLRGRAALSVLGRTLLAASIAASLSAVLWLPTVEVLLRSSRAALPEATRVLWSVPPLGLSRTLLPLPYSDLPLSGPWQDRLFDTVPPFLHSLYLGLPTLALALAARKSGHRKLCWASGMLVAGALALALGPHAPFYRLAVQLFPPLSIFRYPSKVMLLATLGWALLVAAGVDTAQRDAAGRDRRALSALGLLGALVAASGVVVLLRPAVLVPILLPPPWVEPLADLSRFLASGLARSGVALIVVVVVLGACRGTRRKAGVLAVVVICIVDLALAHRSLNLTTPRRLVTFRPPILGGMTNADHRRLYVYEYFLTPGSSQRYLGREDPYVIQSRPGQVLTPELKVLSQRLYPFPPVAGRWGFEGSFDVDTRGLYPSEVTTLVTLLRAVEGTPLHLRLLRLGAVREVIALHTLGFEGLDLERTLPSLFPERIRRFGVPDPLPRAYVVGASRTAEGRSAVGVLLDPAFDPAREVVLASAPVSPASLDFHGTSRILELVSDRVLIDVELSAPGFLVLVDAYDPGWKATLDGSSVPVLRANLAFRAVAVPAGRHVVQFLYRPLWLLRGLGLSLATMISLLSIGLVSMWRRDKRRGRTGRSGGGQPSGPVDGSGEPLDDRRPASVP